MLNFKRHNFHFEITFCLKTDQKDFEHFANDSNSNFDRSLRILKGKYELA